MTNPEREFPLMHQPWIDIFTFHLLWAGECPPWLAGHTDHPSLPPQNPKFSISAS
jgi:hypothetical protein